MKFRVLKKIVKLMYGLSNFNGKPFRFLYETEYKKNIVTNDLPESSHLDRVTPEEVGIERERIDTYFNLLESTSGIVAHSAIVTRHSKVIGEHSVYPYDKDVFHTSFSMSKSVVGLVVGIAIDEGYMRLEDKIGDLVDFESYSIVPDDEVKEVTVKQLLNMTARVDYGEDGALVEADWLKGFMEAGKKSGEGFAYNSMCTFVLAVLVGARTGVDFSEYTREKLFEPLGIKSAFFERNAVGQVKGGFGLLITVEDMAKLGNLVLNGGVYEGKRVVSQDYVTQAVSVQSRAPEYVSKYDYGYQIWTEGEGGVYIFNGMFGQNVFIFPKTDIVVAVTGGDNDMFHDNPIFELTCRFFKDLDYIPQADKREEKGENTLSIDWFCDKRFTFDKKASRIGLMPIVSGVFQGTYPSGLKSLKFSNDTMLIEEYSSTYTIPLTTTPTRRVVDISGDRYEIASIARSEGDSLIVDVYFLELVSKRRIIVTPCGDKITLSWSEEPGVDFLKGGRKLVLGAVKGKRFLTWLLSRRANWLWRRVSKTLSPKVVGKISNR